MLYHVAIETVVFHTWKDNMLFSRAKTSCFCMKADLVFDLA